MASSKSAARYFIALNLANEISNGQDVEERLATSNKRPYYKGIA